MATTARAKPPTTPTRYEDDLYTWVQEQVALLRAGRLSEVDAANLAEEISDVGRSEYSKLQSAIMVLTMHLLKWDHQPRRRSLSWLATINEQRGRLAEVLEENPGLKSRISSAIESGYRYGRDRAVAETKMKYEVFPESCPYTFEDMLSRPIEFEPHPRRRRKVSK